MDMRGPEEIEHMEMPCTHKVDVPISVPDLKWTLVFEWCMVRLGSKNGHQKDNR